jgi:hypothetical protein
MTCPVNVSAAGGYPYAPHMTIPSGGILIGYARCSTDEQDLTAQRLAGQDSDLEPDAALRGRPRRRRPARTIRKLAAAVARPWAHTRLAARDAPSIAA